MLEKLIDLFWSGVSILLALGIAGGVSFFIWRRASSRRKNNKMRRDNKKRDQHGEDADLRTAFRPEVALLLL